MESFLHDISWVVPLRNDTLTLIFNGFTFLGYLPFFLIFLPMGYWLFDKPMFTRLAVLVGLVGHRGLADLAAETHGLLSVFAHGPLVGLEETPERGALVVVQIAEEFLRIELTLGLAALTFGGADIAALAVCRAGLATFATRGVVAAGLGGANFATRVFTGAELTARRALAFHGAVFTGTVLGGDGSGQCHEGHSAERREQRAGDGGQFHIF